IQNALRQAKELADEQKEVANDVNGLEQAGGDRPGKAQQLAQRKDAMDRKVGDLQKQLEQLGNETRRDEKDASRKLDDAANMIRDKRIREKIRYSRGTLGGQPGEFARAMEQDIGGNLSALEQKVGEAAAAMGSQNK